MHKKDLTSHTVDKIIHEVMVNKLSHGEAAVKFKVKCALVSKLVRAYKKDCGFVQAIRDREQSRLTKSTRVVDAVNEILATRKNLWRTAQVVEHIQSKYDCQVKPHYVSFILRNCLKMRYRKVKRVPFQGNSERCMILRQQFGAFMLDVLVSGKRVINVDETWINESDFRKMKWRQRNQTNSLPIHAVSPRLSCIVAIDTDGRVYFALTQVNTDSDIFMLFMKRLMDKLTSEDRSWRTNTVLLIDGAPYHRSDTVRDFLRKSKAKVVLSAPYSYEAAPVELFFSMLKRTNLNPSRVSTGKK